MRHRRMSNAVTLTWALKCKSICETCPNLTVCTRSGISGLAEASIKGQWAFGSKRGALLIMAHPRSSYIPRDTILKHLAKVQALKNRYLVTEVFMCPAYCLYLSNGSECNPATHVCLMADVIFRRRGHRSGIIRIASCSQHSRSDSWR